MTQRDLSALTAPIIAPLPSAERKLHIPDATDRVELARVLRGPANEARACLVGTQSAGKSMFAQYLHRRNPKHTAHRWSLEGLFREAMGSLEFSVLAPSERVRLLVDPADDATASSSKFIRAPGSKSIVRWSPTRTGAKNRGVTFFDLPGEAPLLGYGKEHNHDRQSAVNGMVGTILQQCRVVVLFVPFWSLLPEDWLIAYGAAALQDAATSRDYSATTSFNPSRLDEERLTSLCDLTTKQTQAWLDLIHDHVGPDTHLCVVLSQFQEEPVKRLLDGFGALYGAPSLGTDLWGDLAEVYAQAHEGSTHHLPLARLAAATNYVDNILFRLLTDIHRLAGSPRNQLFIRLATCKSLLDVVDKSARRSAMANSTSAKLRSISMLPLNLFRVDSNEEFDRWAADRGSVKDDFRGCEDVLWTMMTRLHGEEIWAP